MTSHDHEASMLHHYLRVLRRRKWIALQAVVLTTLAALVYSLQQQHLYRATADVWMNKQDLSGIVTGGIGANVYISAERYAEPEAELARVATVARRALRAARIRDRFPADVLENSSVTPKPNSDLLSFSVTDAVPAVAIRLATSYAKAYTAYRHQLSTGALQRARKQVETQLRQLRAIGSTRSPLYLTLVQKDQQLQAIEALLTPPIVARPATSAPQVQPRPVQYGILGIVAGLGIGLALAFLREALDTRFRTADEIGQRLGLPLLARLPPPPARLRSEQKLSMLEEPDGVHAESFRVLRTNLEFVNMERSAQIVMVTSALEAEGKSTTVANLAVAFARAGRRVIAVDLDLRRPLLDRLFKLGRRPGLTQVVIGQITLEDALVPVPLAEAQRGARLGDVTANGGGSLQGLLEVLPAGPLPPEVGEFVGSRRLGDVFEQLRPLADVILVDAPPLLRVGDAITLSGKVDGMLVVVNLATTRRPAVNELRRVLDASPAEKLGFVLTGSDVEDGYGYGYGYSYGYGEPRPSTSREPEIVG